MKLNISPEGKWRNILSKGLQGLLALATILINSCSKDHNDKSSLKLAWDHLGLDGLVVSRLELQGNQLYAITDDGLYAMDLESGNTFTPFGLQGMNILDLVDFGQGHFMASYRDQNNWEDFGRFETFDGGQNWTSHEHTFGEDGQDEAITDFYWDATSSILYATGTGVLAKSMDKGSTWELIYGYWISTTTGMMVEVNPIHKSDIWIGGQGSIENGYLVYFKNESIVYEWMDLVPNPTVVKEIYFEGTSSQNIYVGWEGALLKSSDNGSNWTTLIDEHEESSFFYGIGVSVRNSNLVFTGKWNKGMEKQDLTLYYSQNGGKDWYKENHLPEQHGGILDLKMVNGTEGERIFLALDKGGVYEVSYELDNDLND